MNYEELYYENRKRKNTELSSLSENENIFLKQKMDDENKRFLSKTKIQQLPELKINSLNHARMMMKSKKNIEIPGNESNNNVKPKNLEITNAENLTLKHTLNIEKEIFLILEKLFGFKISRCSTENNEIFEFYKNDDDKNICHFQLIFDSKVKEDSLIEYVPKQVNLNFDEEDQIFLNERLHIIPSDLPYILSNFVSKFNN